MPRIGHLVSLLSVAGFLLVLAGAAAAAPHTVREYYLLVPNKYVPIPNEGREAILRKNKAVVDLKNGYLAFHDEYGDRFACALFKRSDGHYLIAVTSYGPELGKPGKSDRLSDFFLLRYEDGRWEDVTRATLPVAQNRQLVYELPRQGTTIVVRDFKGNRQFDLLWDRSRFVLSKPR
jgi:hypothetical protein